MLRPAGLVALLALATTLVGCVGQDDGRVTPFPAFGSGDLLRDWSYETLTISIDTPGAYRVGIPLPLSPGVAPEDWIRNASASSRGSVSARLADSDHGALLLLSGSGDAGLRSIVLQVPHTGNRCCAEAYLDAQWSTQDGEAAWVWVPEGSVRLGLHYEAASNWCGATAEFQQDGLRGGWMRLDLGRPLAWCT